MTVKIEEKLNFFPLRFELLEEIDETAQFWIQKVSNGVEASIKISPTKASSIVSCDYSIRINHRDDIKIQVRQ